MVEIRAEVVWEEVDRRLWSIAVLAEKTGLHRSTLDRLPRSGAWRVHRHTADAIARAFELNPVRPMVDRMLTGGQA